MLDPLAIHVDAVVIVLGVHNETSPLAPAGWYVRAVVLVQVFPEVTWQPKKLSLINKDRPDNISL